MPDAGQPVYVLLPEPSTVLCFGDLPQTGDAAPQHALPSQPCGRGAPRATSREAASAGVSASRCGLLPHMLRETHAADVHSSQSVVQHGLRRARPVRCRRALRFGDCASRVAVTRTGRAEARGQVPRGEGSDPFRRVEHACDKLLPSVQTHEHIPEPTQYTVRIGNVYFLSRIGLSLRWATRSIPPEETPGRCERSPRPSRRTGGGADVRARQRATFPARQYRGLRDAQLCQLCTTQPLPCSESCHHTCKFALGSVHAGLARKVSLGLNSPPA
jgi:hypothetical protein